MIARILATVRAAQDRPANPLALIAGTALVAMGLSLVDRYNRGQNVEILARRAELEQLEGLLVRAREQVDEAVDQLRPHRVKTPMAYPERQDVDPLGAGEPDAS